MSGFTDEERAAWIERNKREEPTQGAPQWGDTTCLHCQRQMFHWQASDPENPICDTCL